MLIEKRDFLRNITFSLTLTFNFWPQTSIRLRPSDGTGSVALGTVRPPTSPPATASGSILSRGTLQKYASRRSSSDASANTSRSEFMLREILKARPFYQYNRRFLTVITRSSGIVVKNILLLIHKARPFYKWYYIFVVIKHSSFVGTFIWFQIKIYSLGGWGWRGWCGSHHRGPHSGRLINRVWWKGVIVTNHVDSTEKVRPFLKWKTIFQKMN